MKRTFLQLAQVYIAEKHSVGNWYVSEKLDGQRAFWDGGISRGLACRDVPYANTVKDSRLIDEPIATGLWSRMAKPIHAPNWWLDQLPPIPLDGELFLGRQQNQEMASIVRSHSKGIGWEAIQYRVLDSPPLETIFADGEIEIRFGNEKYYLFFKGIMDWVKKRGPIKTMKMTASYYVVYDWLAKQEWKGTISLHEQEQLPPQEDKMRVRLQDHLDLIKELGGEGVVLRSNSYPWVAERTKNCLKVKPDQDDEAIVVGYVWGREGKLIGMMGAMVLDYQGQRLELSGFTDKEREMTPIFGQANPEEGLLYPGQPISTGWTNSQFPIGSTITFRYRELSKTGIPKEARYYRKRLEP